MHGNIRSGLMHAASRSKIQRLVRFLIAFSPRVAVGAPGGHKRFLVPFPAAASCSCHWILTACIEISEPVCDLDQPAAAPPFLLHSPSHLASSFAPASRRNASPSKAGKCFVLRGDSLYIRGLVNAGRGMMCWARRRASCPFPLLAPSSRGRWLLPHDIGRHPLLLSAGWQQKGPQLLRYRRVGCFKGVATAREGECNRNRVCTCCCRRRGRDNLDMA